MSNTLISIVCASSGKNLELSNTLKIKLNELNINNSLIDLTTVDLPVYTPSKQKKSGIPNAVAPLLKNLMDATAMIFIAPEYNGGIPPCLNNALAWISVSGGDDWREAFNGIPAVLATHSGGGGLHALAAMRAQLSYLGMNIIGRQIQTNFGKPLDPKSADAVLSELIKLEKA